MLDEAPDLAQLCWRSRTREPSACGTVASPALGEYLDLISLLMPVVLIPDLLVIFLCFSVVFDNERVGVAWSGEAQQPKL